jgi:prepilin peptidase CpaA
MPTGFAMDATYILLFSSVLLMAVAGIHDVATRTVPNWIPGLLLLIGVALRCLCGPVLHGLLCAAIVFVVTAFFWRRRWMGGADVKLLTVAVLLVPPSPTDPYMSLVFFLLLSVALAGGLLVFLYLGLRLILRYGPSFRRSVQKKIRGRRARMLTRISRIEGRRIRRLESLPYASAIALGTIFVIITRCKS